MNSESTPAPSLVQLRALSDEELLELVKDGCRDAMTPLYHRYCRLVAGIAHKILQDREEAKDMVQEVFLRVYRRVTLFDSKKGTVKAWLMGISYHESLKRRQYLSYRMCSKYDDANSRAWGNGDGHEHGDDGDHECELHYQPDLLDALNLEQCKGIIRRGMAQLPVKQRQALELACFESLMMKDVADRMKETTINAFNHYYRGLKRLREIVDVMLAPQVSTATALDCPAPARNGRAAAQAV